jgi:nitrite reductase (NADH) small subunit
VAGSDAPGSARCHVGRLGDFELNVCRIVEVAGREVGIIRTEQGVFAIANRCPHMGGGICYGTITGVMTASSPEDITYDEEQKAVRCPWHGWEFLLSSGAAVGGITNRRLRRFPLQVIQDDVYVILREARPGRSGQPRGGDGALAGTDAAH